MADTILPDTVPEPATETAAQPGEKKPKKASRKKIEPGIRQRGNRWVIDTYYKFHRLRESYATYEAADENLRKLKTLIDENRYMEKKRESTESLGAFAKRYVDWCVQVGQKAAYHKNVNLRPLLAHFGEKTTLSRITRSQVEDYQAKRLSQPGERRKVIKPATVNREIATLKHLFSKAVEWKVVDDSPARGIRMLKENNRRLRFLSVEECNSLLAVCPTQPPLRQVVVLALNTGMRKGEILGLKWENVNLRERFIELPDQKSGEAGTVPLNQTAVDLLRSIPRRLDSEYVFTGKIAGEPFYDLKGRFEQAVKASKMEGVTFHTLRHTAASHLVMAGVDLATVREILRHKTIEMTLRYAHLAPEHKKSAVEALGAALAGEADKGAKTA